MRAMRLTMTEPKPLHPVLLVLGTHAGWADDADRLQALGVAHDVAAVNDAIVYHARPIRHAVSMHAALIGQWLTLRNARRVRPIRERVWGHSVKPGHLVDLAWSGTQHMSSGMLATRVGLALGYRLILVCCPLEGRHFFDPTPTRLPYPRWHQTWAKAAEQEFGGRVRAWLPVTDPDARLFITQTLGAPTRGELGLEKRP